LDPAERNLSDYGCGCILRFAREVLEGSTVRLLRWANERPNSNDRSKTLNRKDGLLRLKMHTRLLD
jgi:hypothetical protein